MTWQEKEKQRYEDELRARWTVEGERKDDWRSSAVTVGYDPILQAVIYMDEHCQETSRHYLRTQNTREICGND